MLLPTTSRSAIGLLRMLIAGSVLIPTALFVGASWLNYREAFAHARMEVRHTSEVAVEQAAKVFDGQNQVVDRVNDLVRGLDVETIRRTEKSLHEAFAGIVAHLPQVQSVLLVASNGDPLVSAGVYPVPRDADVKDRDYFQAIIGGDPGPYVAALQVGKINRQLFFGLARPWLDASGRLAGVVDVAVSPQFFQDFYRVLIGEGPDGPDGKVVTLVRDDGKLLSRYPPLPEKPPQAPTSGPFFTALRENPDGGVYESQSIVDADAPARVYAYRRVPGYPVYVVAGRSRAMIIAGWRRTMASHLIFGIPAMLALFAVTWTAHVRARGEQEALAFARQEIARRERAEAALLRAQRLEAVGQITGGVAHDFNNLLTIIMGSAEMLARRAEEPARVRRIADQIKLAVHHGGQVTQQLLTFARRQLVKPETLDLNRRIEAFRQLLDPAASEAVTVDLDLDPTLHPVHLDPGHFEAALLNVVGNARDAMAQGGRIRIATRNVVVPAGVAADLPPGSYVCVSVTDTGTGMDAETASKAFEPFFTTKEVGRGTGLGLSQVYGFAKQAGGDVRIVTAPGRGTTVELLLPRATVPPPPTVPASEPVGAAEPHAGEVVLVVEDEPNLRAIAVESLTELGYATLTAANAEAALAHLRESGRIDVLFSDVVMPGGMNGIELSAEARRLRPDLKVLLTSGYTAGAGASAIRPGDVALLTKPYDRSELATRLTAVLRT